MPQTLEREAVRRNQRMDLYRGMAIYGVVFIHVLFPGGLGALLRVLFLFGVPFFFLTAGYFSHAARPQSVGRRALRCLRQLILACVPYFLLGCGIALGRGEPETAWLSTLRSPTVFRQLVLFQIIPFPYAWQLWFLGALFLAYLVWYWVAAICQRRDKPLPYNAVAALSLALLGVHLLLGEGAGLVGKAVEVRYLRNALLDGLPFFLLGAWAAARRGAIREHPLPWHWMILGGLALSLAEFILAGKQELYLGTLITLSGLMGRAICYRRAGDGPLSRALQFCGRELTLYIFILHLLILGLIREVPWLHRLAGLTPILPVVVALLSTLAALGCHQSVKRWNGTSRRISQ